MASSCCWSRITTQNKATKNINEAYREMSTPWGSYRRKYLYGQSGFLDHHRGKRVVHSVLPDTTTTRRFRWRSLAAVCMKLTTFISYMSRCCRCIHSSFMVFLRGTPMQPFCVLAAVCPTKLILKWWRRWSWIFPGTKWRKPTETRSTKSTPNPPWSWRGEAQRLSLQNWTLYSFWFLDSMGLRLDIPEAPQDTLFLTTKGYGRGIER